MAKYYEKNNIHIVEIPIEEFSIAMVDKRKKSCGVNTATAGFFGGWHDEDGSYFTFPVGHLVCDFEAKNKVTRFYCEQWGKFDSEKFIRDCSKMSYGNPMYQKSVSTLLVGDGTADIVDITKVPEDIDYALSGIPIMRDGNDVKYATYVRGQGWDGSSFRATWSNFIGLKKDKKVIYLMAMQTTTSNMVLSAEAYRKFKAIDMYDVIKLDGGGSFWLNVDGKTLSTSENRQINTIIRFGTTKNNTNTNANTNVNVNPYKAPTVALKRGNPYKEQNKWLQWQLTSLGFECEIDGSFGPATEEKVIAFQISRNLEDDGSVGPLTKKALLA